MGASLLVGTKSFTVLVYWSSSDILLSDDVTDAVSSGTGTTVVTALVGIGFRSDCDTGTPALLGVGFGVFRAGFVFVFGTGLRADRVACSASTLVCDQLLWQLHFV